MSDFREKLLHGMLSDIERTHKVTQNLLMSQLRDMLGDCNRFEPASFKLPDLSLPNITIKVSEPKDD